MYDVIAIGSATRDVFLASEGFEIRKHADSPTGLEQCFSLGSKLEIKKIVFTTGGGGSNAAVTFGRQKLKTAYVGVVGNDSIGREVIDELKKEKIDTRFVHRHKYDTTAYSTILVYPSGERTILSYKGEGQHFSMNEIPFSKLKSKWFYIDSLGGHYDVYQGLVEHAVKNNIKIMTNPGGKELAHGLEKLKPLLACVDIFMANKEECAELVGVPASDKNEILNRLQAFVKGIVILTDGHNGVTLRVDGVEYSAGVPSSPVVERTGAGDAFGSGFLSEYVRSGDIKKAIQYATANSSSVVTEYGSKAGILKKNDLGPWPLVEVAERKI